MTEPNWSNLAKITFKRTYARTLPGGTKESFREAAERVIAGNVRGHDLPAREIERLRHFLTTRKACPAGRGWWFSGTESHERIGGVALSNCWFVVSDDWHSYVVAQDLLMQGGGVGMSVEHKYTSKLPKIKKGVQVVHRATKDADFIVPDSREGWCELTRRVLESFFATGRGFTFSTVCVRGQGELIRGFGGSASGPLPLVAFVDKISALLQSREGKHLRPIDAADLLCSIGEMVKAGNVRRSALIILGDAWDKEYLKSKRWDLGPIPTQRSNANYSVVCEDVEDLHPLFWKTYEQGEPFGVVNVRNIQKYGRMGELKKDTATGVNPCVPAGTKILTRNGYVEIERLVGKQVDVWNGFEFSSVIPQVTGENQPLVTVALSSGQELTCTPAHKWIVQDGYSSPPRKVRADELEPGMKIAKFELPVIREGHQFDEAYTQGFYSGDGNSGASAKILTLYGDKIKLADRMAGKLGKFDVNNNRRPMYLWKQPFGKDFVPFDWNLQSRLSWFAGLLDSDGTELKEGGTQVCSVDRDFLCNVQLMLTTMGVNSKVTRSRGAGEGMMPDGRGGMRLYPHQATYRLLVGAVQMQDLKGHGLNCGRLTLNKEPQRDATRFAVVVDVQPAGTADVVYCFQEQKRSSGCFEGIVTGQCAEATLEPYENCVSGDTIVITRSGAAEIRDLVGAGIEVWNGAEWSGVAPRKTGHGDLYRVYLSDGSHLDCTAYHRWSVKDRLQETWHEIKTADLMSYSKLRVQVEPAKIEADRGIDYPDAYTFGVAQGVGYIDQGHIAIKLFGKKIDLPTTGNRGQRKRAPKYNVDHERVCCNHLDVPLFLKLREGDRAAFLSLFSWSSKSILEFVAGWIDTDGSATPSGGVRLYVSQKSRALMMQLLLLKAGVKSSVCLMSRAGSRTNYGTRNHDMWYLQITDCAAIPTHRVDTGRGHKIARKGRYQYIVRVEKLEGTHDTFCFNEPLRHKAVFGNVLTHQCNLQEIALPNLSGVEEFEEAARLMHRWGKRVTLERYGHSEIEEVVARNRRVGTGITGCLQSPLFAPDILDRVYAAIQDENVRYSSALGINPSIRTTVVKPSGTMSKVLDVAGEGIHPAFSRHIIQRIRFASTDGLIPLLREAGHPMEPEIKFDGSADPTTMVVDFYVRAPEGLPVSDEGFDTWKQLEALMTAQRHWADQAVSVTVYYRREEIPQIKQWLAENLKNLKTISFLCHSDHGFRQAPKEAISAEEYEKRTAKIGPIEVDRIVGDGPLDALECAGGACPVR